MQVILIIAQLVLRVVIEFTRSLTYIYIYIYIYPNISLHGLMYMSREVYIPYSTKF